jgi:hypothetical protein
MEHLLLLIITLGDNIISKSVLCMQISYKYFPVKNLLEILW